MFFPTVRLFCAFAFVAHACAAEKTGLPPTLGRTVDFAKEVQPIFAASCIKCHGPEKQKGGYRLDGGRSALTGGDSFAPNILPGKSADSPLVHFISGVDPEMKMPSKGEPLTPEQIGIIRAWIDQGAPWPEDSTRSQQQQLHWAFAPVRRPAVPTASSGEKAAQPIDAFLRAKLSEHKLALSPEADPRTLVRRLYFDLIGLPPTPEEVDAFIRGQSGTEAERAAHFAREVEKLLASPHYGERWARHWLDVVRFAESDGFETNQPRPNAWPYRDYVIRAFNRDQPYDAFIREQIAGDALGVDEATGFLVGGPKDIVKSPDPVLTAQQRADELHDIVSTTGSAFLGLTVGCARCHNHKFDPISQADYHAIKAVFAGVRHGERAMRAEDAPERERQAAAAREALQKVEAELAAFEPVAHLGEAPAVQRPPVVTGRNSDRFSPVEARFVRFTVKGTSQLEPCIDELEIFTAEPQPRNVALATAGARATASGVYAGSPFHRLEHINDGRYGNEYSWISNQAGGGWVQVELARNEKIERIVWSRDRSQVPRYQDRLATQYVVEVSSDGQRWQQVASSTDRYPQGAKNTDAYLRSTLTKGEAARVDALLAERTALSAKIATAASDQMVYAGQFGKPEETRRFHRGDPMQPREVSAPGGLSSFGGPQLAVDAPEQERRLALAKWIASPENPLTARVMVNRLWHYHFGVGLVETPSDFGINGGRPSHPELLDWLAAEFVDSGWRVKHLQRLIVTSAAYRQASTANPVALAIDAGARLLWRFPPRRLEAEALRDTILAVSGKLDLRAGGPGFDLFEPNTNYVKVYATKTQFSPDDFRRMVYQAKPRVELDTLFGAFDCPDAGQISPRRTSSTTPLQALNLLNSEFMLQQSAAFAERLERETGSGPESITTRAFQLAFHRAPAADELSAGTRLLKEHGLLIFCRALFNANEFLTVF